MTEQEIEQSLIENLVELKYTYRPDIRDRAALETNFRQHFEALNRVHLTDSEFARLLESIVTPDVFAASKHLREKNSFERDDGTPLYYTLVNIKEWCKNSFEVINQLRISTDYSQQTPGKQKMSREGLISLIQADAKFMDERDDIAEYIGTLEAGKALDENAIRAGFERFKAGKHACQIKAIAEKHGLETVALQGFVDAILRRMVFDGEQLSDLMAPLELGWKARTKAELALMGDLIPLLHKLAQGREISGLGAYEQ